MNTMNELRAFWPDRPDQGSTQTDRPGPPLSAWRSMVPWGLIVVILTLVSLLRGGTFLLPAFSASRAPLLSPNRGGMKGVERERRERWISIKVKSHNVSHTLWDLVKKAGWWRRPPIKNVKQLKYLIPICTAYL